MSICNSLLELIFCIEQIKQSEICICLMYMAPRMQTTRSHASLKLFNLLVCLRNFIKFGIHGLIVLLLMPNISPWGLNYLPTVSNHVTVFIKKKIVPIVGLSVLLPILCYSFLFRCSPCSPAMGLDSPMLLIPSYGSSKFFEYSLMLKITIIRINIEKQGSWPNGFPPS